MRQQNLTGNKRQLAELPVAGVYTKTFRFKDAIEKRIKLKGFKGNGKIVCII
ncbi:hypothetical protein AHMF7616_01832 [Adhaeribacter pallidiroseus]|uniref:Uncharacterized protein n=1 Tax=Adhaeribacter pallidiroseus TaxID=2072847 RepID=A0A369QE87_9BACT|nr:hypothetical protein AHMF7616_01832 [Adhaeribacter pallidiroseus]